MKRKRLSEHVCRSQRPSSAASVCPHSTQPFAEKASWVDRMHASAGNPVSHTSRTVFRRSINTLAKFAASSMERDSTLLHQGMLRNTAPNPDRVGSMVTSRFTGQAMLSLFRKACRIYTQPTLDFCVLTQYLSTSTRSMNTFGCKVNLPSRIAALKPGMAVHGGHPAAAMPCTVLNMAREPP